jgi:hypothetical protein
LAEALEGRVAIADAVRQLLGVEPAAAEDSNGSAWDGSPAWADVGYASLNGRTQANAI